MKNCEIMVLGKRTTENEWQPMILTDLESKQAYVEGYIERIELPHGIDMWVNEEYLLLKNDVNVLIHGNRESLPVIVFGNVFLASSNSDAEMTSLSETQFNWIIEQTEIISLPSVNNPVFKLNIYEGGL